MKSLLGFGLCGGQFLVSVDFRSGLFCQQFWTLKIESHRRTINIMLLIDAAVMMFTYSWKEIRLVT